MQAIEQYNHFCNLFMINGIEADTPADTNDKYSYKNVNNWYMPDHYKNLSIELELIQKLESMGYGENSAQWKRVRDEYAEFESRGLEPLLKYMIYLVDIMRENKIVWGVGRGSSVASYVLFLIGVHKIDSIKYDLDYKEFFR
jgi:DNA polymerase III alpha subunit